MFTSLRMKCLTLYVWNVKIDVWKKCSSEYPNENGIAQKHRKSYKKRVGKYLDLGAYVINEYISAPPIKTRVFFFNRYLNSEPIYLSLMMYSYLSQLVMPREDIEHLPWHHSTPAMFKLSRVTCVKCVICRICNLKYVICQSLGVSQACVV